MRTKRKRRPHLFFFLCLLVFFGTGLFYLLSLPLWKITEVAVSGAQMLSAEEIRSLSGIPLSENLFLTSFSRTRSNLRKISAIEKFNLYRIPPGTVIIRISERKPIAVIILKNKSAIIDKEGFILNRNPNLTLNVPNITDLPVISGIGTEEVKEDERINPKISHLISEIILELSNLIGSRQIQLELGGFEKINVVLNDILRVKIGRDEDIKRKMAVFKRLLLVIANKWTLVEYVDVRYPDNPVIKFR